MGEIRRDCLHKEVKTKDDKEDTVCGTERPPAPTKGRNTHPLRHVQEINVPGCDPTLCALSIKEGVIYVSLR